MAADILFDEKQVKIVNSANLDCINVNDNGVELKNGNGTIKISSNSIDITNSEVSITSPHLRLTGEELRLQGNVMLFKNPGGRPFPIGIMKVNINDGLVDLLRTIGLMASQINQMQDHIKALETKLGM